MTEFTKNMVRCCLTFVVAPACMLLVVYSPGCTKEGPQKHTVMSEADAEEAVLRYAKAHRELAATINDGPGRFQFRSGDPICILDTIKGDVYFLNKGDTHWHRLHSPLDGLNEPDETYLPSEVGPADTNSDGITFEAAVAAIQRAKHGTNANLATP